MLKRVAMILVGLTVLSPSTPEASRADWPTWRHDPQRSGASSAWIDVAHLNCAWVWRSPSPPRTAWPGPAKWDAYAKLKNLAWMREYDSAFHPIIFGGRVYFGSSVDDTLRCLRLADGRPLWEFTADGPVRTAATGAGPHVFFGSDDGNAYCLDAQTGHLIWQFQPPAADRQPLILHNGRLISRLPCRTGVLVDNGTAYCGFGLLPWESSFLCAIDAHTGKPTAPQHYIRTFDGDTWEGPLLRQGDYLVAPRGRIEPAVILAASGRVSRKIAGGGGCFVAADSSGQLWHGPGNKTGWISVTSLASGQRTKQWTGMKGGAIGTQFAVLCGNSEVIALQSARQVLWRLPRRGVHCVALSKQLAWLGASNELLAVKLSDGNVVWRASVDGAVKSIALTDAAVVAATDLGHVYCFAPRDTASPPLTKKPAVAQAELHRDGAQPVAKRPDQRGESDRRFTDGTNRHAPDHEWTFARDMDRYAKRRGFATPGEFVPDRRGNWHGQIHGQRHLWQGGGVEALQLDGSTYVELPTLIDQLPTRAITAEAWVNVDSRLEWGGILGCIRDNGSDEQGWSLGFRTQQFSFAVRAARGENRLTYLRAPQPFEFGRWYHVVGTYDGKRQRLYVNGELVAESEHQQGPIQYPPSGWMTIGSYRDENEDYRMKGMVERVAIYRQALPAAVVRQRYQNRVDDFPRVAKLAVGPLVRFPSPTKARIQFQTAAPVAARVVFQRHSAVRRLSESRPTRLHEFEVGRLAPRETVEYSIQFQHNEKTYATPTLRIENEFNHRLAPLDAGKLPSDARQWSDDVRRVLGYRPALTLVVGRVSADRIHALVTDDRCMVRQFLLRPSQVVSQRTALRQRPGYGVRFSAQLLPPSEWQRVPIGTANVVVVARNIQLDRDDIRQLANWVQPQGVLLIPASCFKSEQPTWGTRANIGGTEYVTWRRPAVAGSGEWTHLYAHPDNSSYSGERLQGIRSPSELIAQWVGRPGPAAQADRSGRKPSPLAVSGRLFVQGLNRITALDAYNGAIVWELEVADWARFNMPRDCSNWCADDRTLFLAVRDRCYEVDQETGALKDSLPVRKPDGVTGRFDWGFVARSGGLLLGTAVRSEAPFRQFWGQSGWYDDRAGPQTFKVCADSLFALERASHKSRWTYSGSLILNSSITVHRNCIYFVESRNQQLISSPVRRCAGPEFYSTLEFVCLDLQTGRLRWRHPLEMAPPEVALFVASGHDRVVVVTSAAGESHVRAFEASSGAAKWDATVGWPQGAAGDHGKALSRPLIVGDRVYVRPATFALADGRRFPQTVPYGKCGTFACAENLFFFRSQTVSAWSPVDGSLKGWTRLRPDCWLSTLPALGMVLSPEAGGGCSCGYWFEASLGFAPRRGFPLEFNPSGGPPPEVPSN